MAPKGSQELANGINNETITFKVLKKQGHEEYVNFSVISYPPFRSEVKIKLTFKDPMMISNGLENDYLEAEITEDIHASDNNYNSALRYKTIAVKEIPP